MSGPSLSPTSLLHYLTDVSLFGSFLVLLYKMISRRTARGVSAKTQILYLLMFCSRYINKTLLDPPLWDTIVKILFLVFSALVVLLMICKFQKTYDKRHDAFRIVFILVIAGVASYFSAPTKSIAGIAYTFSFWIESLLMVPQIILLGRLKGVYILTRNYLLVLSLYQLMRSLDWISRLVQSWKETPKFVWITGSLQLATYGGFLRAYAKATVKGPDDALPR